MSEDEISNLKLIICNLDLSVVTKEKLYNQAHKIRNQLQQKENIIKEVREHIEKTIEYEKSCGFNRWTYDGGQEEFIDMVEKTLDILDKEN